MCPIRLSKTKTGLPFFREPSIALLRARHFFKLKYTISTAMSAGLTPEMRPACPQIRGADAGELLPRFQPQAVDGLVVDVGRQRPVFHLLGLFDLLQPALQIPFVLHVDDGGLDVFRPFARQSAERLFDLADGNAPRRSMSAYENAARGGGEAALRQKIAAQLGGRCASFPLAGDALPPPPSAAKTARSGRGWRAPPRSPSASGAGRRLSCRRQMRYSAPRGHHAGRAPLVPLGSPDRRSSTPMYASSRRKTEGRLAAQLERGRSAPAMRPCAAASS